MPQETPSSIPFSIAAPPWVLPLLPILMLLHGANADSSAILYPELTQILINQSIGIENLKIGTKPQSP